MCFDRRVVIALALVGVGALLISPALAAMLVPVLILAVCPLSMLFMMRGMSRGGSCSTGGSSGDKREPLSERDIAALQAELRQLKAQQAADAANRERI
jgi:hypothetical protein